MKKLSVVYCGWGERWPIGQLADTGRAGAPILFEYSDEARRQGLELSPLRLPLAHPGAFEGEHFFMGLPGLIADALPDGWGLLLMDRAFARSGCRPTDISPLDRLAFIGERAMGALAFVPPVPALLAAEDLDLARLAREVESVLADTPADEALQHLLQLGGSPQGARPKVLADFDPVTGCLSAGRAGVGQPWLFKFPVRDEHRDACAIEELYARVARRCGIEMPETRYFDLSGRYSAFGVRRFDHLDGMRVPLLSLSALLHADFRLPALDYETLLRAVRRLTGDEREVVRAFERCVLNVLLHNRDDHSRNFAFRLGRDRRWRLAPAFDLTFCEGPRGEHQTSVVGEGRAPGRTHLFEVARRSGIPQAEASDTLERLLAGVADLPALAADLPIRKRRFDEMRRILAADWRRVAVG